MAENLVELWEDEWTGYCVKRAKLLELVRRSLDGIAVDENELAEAREAEQRAFDEVNGALDNLAHGE